MADGTGIDAPAPGGAPKSGGSGHGVKGFLTAETAGMPNWVWGVVILAGIGLVFIVPRLRGQSANTAQTGTANGTPSGVGMAIDPTTGLPYAVEGLVPSGAVAGGSSSGQTSDLAALEAFLQQVLQNNQNNNPTPTPTPPTPQPSPSPAPAPAPAPAPQQQQTVTVGNWPNWNGSLWGIAQHVYGNGARWTDIYNANRGVIGGNPNLIRPGQVLVIP